MSVDDLIRQQRTAEATVSVTAEGAPLANAEVAVAQTRHKFLFGSTVFDFIPLANDEIHGEERAQMERLAGEWLALFNFATLPFYWGRFEPERAISGGMTWPETIVVSVKWSGRSYRAKRSMILRVVSSPQ
jgi:endo-1,4-beta-xylanase